MTVTRPPRSAKVGRAAVVLAGLLVAAATAHGRVIDHIVAQVNERIITRSELRERLAPIVYDLQSRLSGDELAARAAEARANMLSNMINEILVLDRADSLGITVEDAALASALEEIKQGHGIRTQEELQAALAREGMDLDTYRDHLRRQMKLSRLLAQEVRAKIDVLESDVTKRYAEVRDERYRLAERVRLRQILLKLPAGSRPEAEAEVRGRAEGLVARLRQGMAEAAEMAERETVFAAIAAAESEGPEAAGGGDIGVLSRGQMLPELEEAAFRLGPGEVSEPVRSEHGFHVLMVIERNPAGYRPLEEVREELEEEILEDRFREEQKRFLETLRERAYIKVLHAPGAESGEPPVEGAGAGGSPAPQEPGGHH